MSRHWAETPSGGNGERPLVPHLASMEETIYHLPVLETFARRERGWWTVQVRCTAQGPFHRGTKDRKYFNALAKALDSAMKNEGLAS